MKSEENVHFIVIRHRNERLIIMSSTEIMGLGLEPQSPAGE